MHHFARPSMHLSRERQCTWEFYLVDIPEVSSIRCAKNSEVHVGGRHVVVPEALLPRRITVLIVTDSVVCSGNWSGLN